MTAGGNYAGNAQETGLGTTFNVRITITSLLWHGSTQLLPNIYCYFMTVVELYFYYEYPCLKYFACLVYYSSARKICENLPGPRNLIWFICSVVVKKNWTNLKYKSWAKQFDLIWFDFFFCLFDFILFV